MKGSRCITKKGMATMFVQQVHLRGRCVAPDAAPPATSRQLRMVSASLLLKAAPRKPDTAFSPMLMVITVRLRSLGLCRVPQVQGIRLNCTVHKDGDHQGI